MLRNELTPTVRSIQPQTQKEERGHLRQVQKSEVFYTKESIELRFSLEELLYHEQMYGKGFQSVLSKELLQEICTDYKLVQNTERFKVLDLGCGGGGTLRCFESLFGKVQTFGLDQSEDAVILSRFRTKRTQFVQGDTQKLDTFAPSSFNLIWCCDVGMYIKDKRSWLKNMRSWLRPGGQLVLLDYGIGSENVSLELQEYIDKKGYHFLTLADYVSLLREQDFGSALAMDQTEFFAHKLEAQLNTKRKKDRKLVERWQQKIKMSQEGELRWHQIICKKSQY